MVRIELAESSGRYVRQHSERSRVGRDGSMLGKDGGVDGDTRARRSRGWIFREAE